MPTLLTSTGYGGTGSSAATNILEEFEPVKSFGIAEFTFAHEPDGIADLENSFLEGHRLKTDLAVKRFLKLASQLGKYNTKYKKCFNNKFEEYAKKYIHAIVSCEWDGSWHRANETSNHTKNQQLKIEYLKNVFDIYLNDRIKYELYEPDNWHPRYRLLAKEYYSHLNSSEKKNNFLEKTKVFTDALLAEAANNEKGKYILLDQAIPPISLSLYTRYFTSPKVIIVDRDPRDLYAINKAVWGCGFFPTCNVQLFIKWYSETRQSRKTELCDLSNNLHHEILFLPFESLIFEYDSSIKKIMDFAVFSANEHTNKLKFFNPDLSSKNTQVFLEYPELISDIKLIEEHLEEYCYNFPQQKNIISNKYFLIEEVNNKFQELTKGNGIFFDGVKKHISIYALFRQTEFYTAIRKRKNVSFLKTLIKMMLYTFFLPLNLLILFIRLNVGARLK